MQFTGLGPGQGDVAMDVLWRCSQVRLKKPEACHA